MRRAGEMIVAHERDRAGSEEPDAIELAAVGEHLRESQVIVRSGIQSAA